MKCGDGRQAGVVIIELVDVEKWVGVGGARLTCRKVRRGRRSGVVIVVGVLVCRTGVGAALVCRIGLIDSCKTKKQERADSKES